MYLYNRNRNAYTLFDMTGSWGLFKMNGQVGGQRNKIQMVSTFYFPFASKYRKYHKRSTNVLPNQRYA